MLCVKCGHDNTAGSKYCGKCNAMMFHMAPESTTTSVIDVEEGMDYISPERNYECRWLLDFFEATTRFTNGEIGFDVVEKVYDNIKKIYESFDNRELPDFLNELDGWRNTELGKEYSRQMTYLLTKGFQLMNEGFESLKGYMSDPSNLSSLQEGLNKLQDGVNQIGLSEEFLAMHQVIIEEEINRRELENKAGDFKAMVDARKAPAAAAAAEEEPAEEPA
jgi:X-X-X-Leu-X-X-Gly heptad repeat protein